ncbi:MAG: S8 family serine peptidase, partial [Candidatus Cloacimonetes bacterium]|nr:S8 family serine peptidase [Candidatus Cloacimonadota bacterium]
MKQRCFSLLIQLRLLVACFVFLVGCISILYSSDYEVIKGERPFIDIYNVPDEAMEDGWIRIKFQEDMTDHLDNTEIIRDDSGITVFDIPLVDDLNQYYNVHTAIKLFDSPALNNEYEWRHRLWGFHLWYELHFDSEVDIRDIIIAYRSLDNIIAWAEPEYKKELHNNDPIRWIPNDPLLVNQWHYNNTGQSDGTPGADISLFAAWDIEKGNSDVIVAIVDGGIDISHVDLAGNMWSGIGYNFAQNVSTIYPHNHGTHVAGTVAAVNNNNIGVAGVAGGSGSGDGVRLMSCQVFSPYGNGGFHLAPIYAADNDASISQNSWGYSTDDYYDQNVLDAIDYFNANGGGDALNGGITIFSAGNSGSTGMRYPGCYEGAFSVAATNNQDQKSYYSTYDTWVDISAPGGETYQVTARGVLSTLNGNTYGYYQGTSMAAPHVSGVAALIISLAYRHGIILNNSQVKDILIDTTDDIYHLNPGYIGMLGSGRLNANAALLPIFFAGGLGTADDPWLIETAEHLNYVRNFLGDENQDKHFKQIANICLEDTIWYEGEGWIPIGNYNNRFRGSYDGNGHTINGLYINRPGALDQGLFGYTHGATIKNLGVTDIDITAYQEAGGLVGMNDVGSTIENCYSTGHVSTSHLNSGGLVGANMNNSIIRNSYSTANVIGNTTVGGLVGFNAASSNIINSYSEGVVTGNSNIGGLVGHNFNSGIDRSYSICIVNGSNCVGGLVGYNAFSSTIINSYSKGVITGNSRTGGLVGYNYNSGIDRSYSISMVNCSDFVGGLVGLNTNGTVDRSYWNIEIFADDNEIGDGKTTFEMLQDNTYDNWCFEETWKFVGFHGNPSIRKHYPVLRWQKSYTHNRISPSNAHVKVYHHRTFYWESFPRLEQQDNHASTAQLLFPLNGTILSVVGQGQGETMIWHPDEGWTGNLIGFNSAKGYILEFNNTIAGDEHYLWVNGNRISIYEEITLEPHITNFVGYFIPHPQNVFDALGSEVISQLRSVEAEDWSLHWLVEDEWMHRAFKPSSSSGTLFYGKMYKIRTRTDNVVTFSWNLPPGYPELYPKPKDPLPRAKHFDYDEKPDYESIFVESIENDHDIIEVAVYVDEECIGASPFLQEYPLEILAYTDESHYGEEISFVILRDDKGKEPQRIRIPQVMNIENGEYSPTVIRPREQKFTVVRLSADDYQTDIVPSLEIILSQNYPNPIFTGSAKRGLITEIPFYVSEAREVKLTIYNIKGQHVKDL